MARETGVPFLKDILSLPPNHKWIIINDPEGTRSGMQDIASSYSTTWSMTRMTLMYEWYGQQVVVVGPRMQAAFANTSLENVPIDMLKFPHQAFYLALPENEDLMLWGGERTGWHRVAGCYVVKEPLFDSLAILAWGSANEKSLNALDDATFWFRLDLDKANLEGIFTETHTDSHIEKSLDSVEGDSVLTERALARDMVNFDRAIDRVMDNAASEASDAGMELGRRGQSADHVKTVKETARKILRIVVNTILYMNSSNAELSAPVTNDSERARLQAKIKGFKKPNKKDAQILRRKLENLPKHRIVWVGPTIESAADGENDLTSETRRKVSGHIRRGHWHTFLVGPRKINGVAVAKDARRKTLKWIPPLWVGSLKESPGPRLYGLKEPA